MEAFLNIGSIMGYLSALGTLVLAVIALKQYVDSHRKAEVELHIGDKPRPTFTRATDGSYIFTFSACLLVKRAPISPYEIGACCPPLEETKISTNPSLINQRLEIGPHEFSCTMTTPPGYRPAQFNRETGNPRLNVRIFWNCLTTGERSETHKPINFNPA